MDYQVLFNIAVAVVGALGGWWGNTMWGEVKALQNADKQLTDKIAAIEVLVAGRYVTRDEFQTSINVLFEKLDRIADRLSTKADR